MAETRGLATAEDMASGVEILETKHIQTLRLAGAAGQMWYWK